MIRWHFYRQSDGVFLPQSFSGPANSVEANTPDGCRAFAGDVAIMSQRVDLETGRLVDYQPPQPNADHEWDATTKRWRKRVDVVQRETRRANAVQAIEAAERAQARAVREALLATLPDGPEKTRLQQIEDQIAARRADLTDTP